MQKEISMIRKIIASLLAVMLLGGLVACANDEYTDDGTGTEDNAEQNTSDNGNEDNKMEDNKEDETPTVTPTTIALNSTTKGIKILGERMLSSESQINCDWTCSGIEFTLDSAGGSLTVKASSDKPCYFRAYVDGVAWSSASGSVHYTVDGESEMKLPAIPKGTHTIRIIKVSGHTLARAELKEMTFYGTVSETAPAKNDTYIEFIGDSISCGWGVLDSKNQDGTYTGQDGSMAYPYLISKELNADYSITALSGQGLVFSGTGMPNMTDGYLLCSPLRDGNTAYEFERKADAVVINIGTNDYSKNIPEAEFKAAYKALIETIREKNGADCKIICLYNTMNDTFSSAITDVCRQLGGQAGGVYCYKLNRANSGHPTSSENLAYVKVIKEVISNALNSVVTENSMTAASNGDGMTVDFKKDLKPLA